MFMILLYYDKKRTYINDCVYYRWEELYKYFMCRNIFLWLQSIIIKKNAVLGCFFKISSTVNRFLELDVVNLLDSLLKLCDWFTGASLALAQQTQMKYNI